MARLQGKPFAAFLLGAVILNCGTSLALRSGGPHQQLKAPLQSHDAATRALEQLFRRWTGAYHDLSQFNTTASEGGQDWLRPDPPAKRLPVLLVPPMMGVEIDAVLDKPARSPHFWCDRSSGGAWQELWVSPRVLIPGQFACIAENLRLHLDPATNRSHPPQGVKTRASGGFNDPKVTVAINVFAQLKEELQHLGWSQGQDLDTHLYDWRLSPVDWAAHDQPQAWADLRREVEALSARNGGRRVVLVSMSLGSPYVTTFLSHMVDARWKDAHVAALISISGVFGGTPMAVWDILSARLQGWESLFNHEEILQLMRAVPALSWLAPRPEVFGEAPVVGNTALKRTWTVSQTDQALRAAGAAQAAASWRVSQPYSAAAAPGVKVYCLYTRGLPTAHALTYHQADFTDTHPDVQYTDGDMTVPLPSLSCDAWAQAAGHPPVITRVWWGVPHAAILWLSEGLQYVVQQIVSLSSEALNEGSKQ